MAVFLVSTATAVTAESGLDFPVLSCGGSDWEEIGITQHVVCENQAGHDQSQVLRAIVLMPAAERWERELSRGDCRKWPRAPHLGITRAAGVPLLRCHFTKNDSTHEAQLTCSGRMRGTVRGDASLEGCACRTQKLEEEVKAAREEMWGAQQTAAAAAAKAEVLQRAVAQVGPCCCMREFGALGWVAVSFCLLTLPSGALMNERRAMYSATAPQLVHQVIGHLASSRFLSHV